jgi:single-strand DNA-binding protein
MNNITIAGPLGRDSELRRLPDGTPILQFSVADSAGRDKPTIWWNCQLFGKRAESLQQYLGKGQQVAVSGSVTEREWKDKDGQPRKSMDVRVNDVALQGRPQGEAVPQRQAAAAPKPSAQGSGFDDMDDDLIPF